jgi:phage shock protein PspC (stress-responsive transcriptional regulator)
MDNRLTRSRSDAMIAGVCSGLGKYLGIDPTLVRLFFVLLALTGNGIGLLLYILLWIVLPLEDQPRDTSFGDTVRSGSLEIADQARLMGDELRQLVRSPNPRAGLIVGSALILLGVVFLLQNLNLPWLNWVDTDVIWPILLIMGGGALLIRHFRGE